jgi:hypothetical protein
MKAVEAVGEFFVPRTNLQPRRGAEKGAYSRLKEFPLFQV